MTLIQRAYPAGPDNMPFGKGQALIATALGTLLAITVDASRFEDFLYFIGSVFAPMTAIMLADYFLSMKTTKKNV